MRSARSRSRFRLPLLVVAVSALLAAILVVTPAGGVISLKSLNKKVKSLQAQVAALQKQQGPPGAPGAPGASGTARAYAHVNVTTCASGTCTADRTNGFSTTVQNPQTGIYCLTASGIDASVTPTAVTVDLRTTASPEGNASAMSDVNGGFTPCSSNQFRVITQRIPDSVSVSGNAETVDLSAVNADDVSFSIVVP